MFMRRGLKLLPLWTAYIDRTHVAIPVRLHTAAAATLLFTHNCNGSHKEILVKLFTGEVGFPPLADI